MEVPEMTCVKTDQPVIINVCITDHTITIQFSSWAPDGGHRDVLELVVPLEEVLMYLLGNVQRP
jgi:hypothetical protein